MGPGGGLTDLPSFSTKDLNESWRIEYTTPGGLVLQKTIVGNKLLKEYQEKYPDLKASHIKQVTPATKFWENVKDVLWGATPFPTAGYPEPTWEALKSPEFTLFVGGITAGAPQAGGAVLRGTSRFIKWAREPVKWGPQLWGKYPLGSAITTFKTAAIPATIAEMAVLIKGIFAEPQPVGTKAAQVYKDF